jgi:hypothetical protein
MVFVLLQREILHMIGIVDVVDMKVVIVVDVVGKEGVGITTMSLMLLLVSILVFISNSICVDAQ